MVPSMVYVLARVACRANKLIGADTCLATFRGWIRTLNFTVSDPSGCLEGVAQFCVLFNVGGGRKSWRKRELIYYIQLTD